MNIGNDAITMVLVATAVMIHKWILLLYRMMNIHKGKNENHNNNSTWKYKNSSNNGGGGDNEHHDHNIC